MDEPSFSEHEIPPYLQPQAERLPFIERYGISPLVFAVVSLIIVFFLYQIVGGLITFVLFGMTPAAEKIQGFRIATGAGQLLFLLVPTLLLTRLAALKPADFLRLKKPTLQTLVVPLVGIFSLQQMLQIYLNLQERIPLPEPLRSKLQELKDLFEQLTRQLVSSHSVPELLWVVLIVALIPALCEELLFRGLVQRSIEKTVTPMRSAVITGIIFGAYHLNPTSFVPLVVLGIYLGFLAMRSGNLWISIATHFYNNLLACIAVFLNVEDDFVVMGNAERMPLGPLLLTFWFFGLVFLLSTIYFIRITAPRKEDHEAEAPFDHSDEM